MIASDDSPQIRIVDAPSGKVLLWHQLDSHSTLCFAVSPDGSTLASSGGTWKTETGQYRDDPDKAIYLWQLRAARATEHSE